jgi:hypothetical protein
MVEVPRGLHYLMCFLSGYAVMDMIITVFRAMYGI